VADPTQTLKKWLRSQPAPTTLTDLQAQLDHYQNYYNTRRPHSALNRRTPQQAWTTAATLGGPSSLPIQADATVHFCPVTPTGVINVGRYRISVGRPRYGSTLTAIRDRDHVTIYTDDGTPLGHANIITDRSHTRMTPIAT
jgi:hypothetical protein